MMIPNTPMGMQIVTNLFMTKKVEVPVDKSWVTKFLDFALQWNPCNPWVSPDTKFIDEPSDAFYVMGNKLICHPSMLPKLREAIANER